MSFTMNEGSHLIPEGPPGPSQNLQIAAIVCIPLLACGVYFAYHAPGALAVDLMSSNHLGALHIGWFFTIYSVPNIVMPMINGALVDQFGLVPVSLANNFLVWFGCVVFELGHGNFILMLLGRFLLGLGAGSVIVCQQSMCVAWFNGRWLGTSLALCMAIQTAGSAAAFLLLPPLATQHGLRLAGWVVPAFCTMSLFFNVLYACIHNYHPGLNFWGRGWSRGVGSGQDSISLSSGCRDWLRTMHQLPKDFWASLLLVFLMMPVEYTFSNFAPDFIQDKWSEIGSVEAGRLAALVYWPYLFLAPVGGVLLDYFGHRLLVQAFACSGVVVGLALLCFTKLYTSTGMLMIGVCFAVVESNCYVMAYRQVDEEMQGRAAGFVGSALYVGLVVVPIICGALKDATGHYNASVGVFLCTTFLGFLLTLALAVRDWHGQKQPNNKSRYSAIQ